MQGEGGSKLQIRCRLILLISEHPIQQGIRKVKSSLLANLRSSLVANYWTVRKCLFSMCFSPFSAIFFAFTPFKYTHNTNFEKKCSPGLDFLSTVKAQTFCRNSGRVATAYSTDKYKYQNMKIRVSWVGQSSTWPPPTHSLGLSPKKIDFYRTQVSLVRSMGLLL